MEKDLISHFDINDFNKTLPQKNLKMSLIVLIFSIIYFIVELKYWYDVIMSSTKSRATPDHFFYLYRISPLISVTEMIVTIISCNYYYNAWKHQAHAIEAGDITLFNMSIKLFNKALVLNISFFLLAFLRMYFRSLYYSYE